MKKMIAAWIFLASTLFLTLLYIGISYTKSVEDYKVLEHDLVESANAYMDIKDIKLGTNSELNISEEQLKDLNLLPNMKVNDDVCTCSINVKKTLNGLKITPTINCKNYKTT